MLLRLPVSLERLPKQVGLGIFQELLELLPLLVLGHDCIEVAVQPDAADPSRKVIVHLGQCFGRAQSLGDPSDEDCGTGSLQSMAGAAEILLPRHDVVGQFVMKKVAHPYDDSYCQDEMSPVSIRVLWGNVRPGQCVKSSDIVRDSINDISVLAIGDIYGNQDGQDEDGHWEEDLQAHGEKAEEKVGVHAGLL